MTTLRKRILVSASLICILVGISLFFIVRNANVILKSQLEKFLGRDFHVERIMLNWGSIDAYGISYYRNGEEIMHADSLNIRADFLGFLKRHYSASRIALGRPYVQINIDKEGRLLLPFSAAGKKEESGKESSGLFFEVGEFSIDNGKIYLLDERLPENQNSVAFENLNLRLDNLCYPFEDSPSRIRFSTVSKGRIIAGSFNAEGKVNLKTTGLDIRFDGKNVVLIDTDTKGPVLSADSIAFTVVSRESPEGRVYTIDDAVIKKPFVRYETDIRGDLANPWGDIIGKLQKAIGSR